MRPHYVHYKLLVPDVYIQTPFATLYPTRVFESKHSGSQFLRLCPSKIVGTAAVCPAVLRSYSTVISCGLPCLDAFNSGSEMPPRDRLRHYRKKKILAATIRITARMTGPIATLEPIHEISHCEEGCTVVATFEVADAAKPVEKAKDADTAVQEKKPK